LSQNDKSVTLKDGVLQREDEFQMVGVYCPDCRGEVIAYAPQAIRRKPDVGWCYSDQHPIFDSTGRLVQMTRVG
jgi:hypothetical protein